MTRPIDLTAIRRGFTNPSFESQSAFRSIMSAMARPGRIEHLIDAPEPPRGLNRACGAIALTLLDFETGLWLDASLRGTEAEAWLRFHCSCPLTTDPSEADFAIAVDGNPMPSLPDFKQGNPRYPDRSTTLIIQVTSLVEGDAVRVEGPGIKKHEVVRARLSTPNFWHQFRDNAEQFQTGVDVMLTDDASVVGLPRTIRTGGE